MFKRKPDIQLSVEVTRPTIYFGYQPSRQYIGTVKVPNAKLSGGFRVCDLYVDVSDVIAGIRSAWRPVIYAVSKADTQCRIIGEHYETFDWDWRQALNTAEQIVLNNWWFIQNKRPLSP